MFMKVVAAAGLLALTGGSLWADFSYKETSRVTGGMIASVMRMAGAFSRQAREPIESTVAVKGDRMVHRTASSATVIDLNSQTITTIDTERKTYSVMTFEEMKQMLEQVSQGRQGGDQPQPKIKVSVQNTGNAKQIAGFEAKELVMKMEMENTDPKTGQTGTMTITSDMWIAPAVSGYDEVRAFQKRMAEKLNWAPGGNMFMSNPQVSQGMAQMYREAGKLDGVPVLTNITMGGSGTGTGAAPAGGEAQQPAASPQTQTQTQPQAQPQQAPQPSVGGALGGLSSRLGGLGGLGRRRQQSQDTPAPAQQPAQTTQQPAPAGNAPGTGSLLEMTTESSGFSSAAVDASLFAIPAGFKKVDSPMRRGR
jgi:hypothetical protein